MKDKCNVTTAHMMNCFNTPGLVKLAKCQTRLNKAFLFVVLLCLYYVLSEHLTVVNISSFKKSHYFKSQCLTLRIVCFSNLKLANSCCFFG